MFLPSLVMKELRGVCPVLSSLCLLGWELQTGLGFSVCALPSYEGVERSLSCPLFTLFIGLGITDRF